jgi:hypothetical protein
VHIFDKQSKLLIFITPAISTRFIEIYRNDKGIIDLKKINNTNYYKAKHEIDIEHHNLHSMLSQAFNFGEIKTINKGSRNEYFAFLYKNKAIWRSNKGLHFDNYTFYTSKL